MLFVIRLVPAVPFFLANLIPSFLEVPLRRFVISTFLGIIPGAVVYTSVGSGLGEVIARGETPNLGVIAEPHILGPILGLAALALLPVILKAVRGKKEPLKHDERSRPTSASSAPGPAACPSPLARCRWARRWS